MDDKIRVSGVLSKGYGISPKLIMTDSNLSIEAKAIYAYLSSFCGNGVTAFPSVDSIMRHLRISKNRFYKYRNELINKGYISVLRRRNGNKSISNLYVINLELLQFEDIQNEDIQIEDLQNEDTNNNNINNNNINNNKEDIYIDIFKHWTSQKGLILHREMTDSHKKAIKSALKKNSKEEIMSAITRVSQAITDESYYYNHKWSLDNFLKQSNGYRNWLDEGQYWVNYMENKGGNKSGGNQGHIKQDSSAKKTDYSYLVDNGK